jgi:hypothetical protein
MSMQHSTPPPVVPVAMDEVIFCYISIIISIWLHIML